MKAAKIYLSLVATTAFWGANFIVGKLAVSVLPPLSVGAWRFIVAALCMVVLLWATQAPAWTRIRPHLLLYALLGAVGVFGFNALLFAGLKETSPVNAALVMATNPLVTALLSAIVLRERLRPAQTLGTLVSLLGVVLVLTGGSLLALRTVSPGDIMVFGGNVCWALYSVAGRRYTRDHNPLTVSTFTMLAGAICFLPFAPVARLTVPPHALLAAAAAIVFMAVCGSVLAYVWWLRAITQLGASRTALFFNLVPVWTLLLTALGGGRVLPAQLGGMALVLAGVSLASARRAARMSAGGTSERAA